MGSWSEQQEVKKEVKEKEKTSRETLGKFFYDLAKISFTALVVGSVVSVATQQEKVEYWILILIGIFVTYIFSYLGYKIIKQELYGSINIFICGNGCDRFYYSCLA